MKMSENEAQQSIAELFRQLKGGGKALDDEKRILESLLRRAGEEFRWFCNCCGKELPESRRKQAIEDFVNWGGISSIKPPGRDTSWDDWVEGIFYQHTEDQFAGVRGIGPYLCSTACEREEREWQQRRMSAREEAERRSLEETMGEYGWCSDHEMPIDEDVASGEGYEDSGNLQYDFIETYDAIDNMVSGNFHLDKWVVLDDVDRMLALALGIPPQPIADWIIQNCRIVLVRAAGTIPPNNPRLKDKFLLYFSPPVMRDWSPAKIIHTILHEAAHAYVMRTTGRISLDRPEERETQVNRLVAQWTKAVQYSKQWVSIRLASL